MSKNCPLCSYANDPQTTFCESCGEPLGNDNAVNLEKRFPEIVLGYNSSIPNGFDKDSFLLLDTTSLFGQENHRRIVCVIVKGLAKFVDARTIMNLLLSDVIRQEGNNDYQKRLLEIKAFLDKEYSFAFSNEQEKTDTGVLVSVIDNGQFTSLCVDGPRIFIANESGPIKVIAGTKKEPIVQINKIENGSYVGVCNIDFISLMGKQETNETIVKALNPQAACDSLIEKIKTKKPEVNLALAIARISG
jgi:hypothetical protein